MNQVLEDVILARGEERQGRTYAELSRSRPGTEDTPKSGLNMNRKTLGRPIRSRGSLSWSLPDAAASSVTVKTEPDAHLLLGTFRSRAIPVTQRALSAEEKSAMDVK